MDEEIYQVVGEHRADIASIKDDIKEIKENQKAFLEFVSEQKAGRKYTFIIFGSVAALVTFAKDILTTISSILSFKGLH